MFLRLFGAKRVQSHAATLALVRTTVGSRSAAEALATNLVDGRLAACAHVVEVSSVYRWEGARRQETEFLVEARTSTARRTALVEQILAGHPYSVPLVESWEVNSVPATYMAWVEEQIGRSA